MEQLSIAVKKRFDPSLPPIRGDRAQLTQVFLNLVKNAFQAMNEGGTLTMASRLETDFHIRGQGSDRSRLIWVDIEDEGVGIRGGSASYLLPVLYDQEQRYRSRARGLLSNRQGARRAHPR